MDIRYSRVDRVIFTAIPLVIPLVSQYSLLAPYALTIWARRRSILIYGCRCFLPPHCCLSRVRFFFFSSSESGHKADASHRISSELAIFNSIRASFSRHCPSMHVHPLRDSCRLLHRVVRIVTTSGYYVALSPRGGNRTASRRGGGGASFSAENSVHLRIDPEEACERRCGVSIPNKPKYLITAVRRWNITIIQLVLVPLRTISDLTGHRKAKICPWQSLVTAS